MHGSSEIYDAQNRLSDNSFHGTLAFAKPFGSQHESVSVESSSLPFIRAVRSTLSPERERFDTPVRSSTRASGHRPSGRAAHKVPLRPNETLSGRSIPGLTGPVSALRCERFLPPQDVLDPKTVALDDPQLAPACCCLAFANRLRESVPRPLALAPSCLGSAQGAVPLRKTPADNPVKLETATKPFVEHPNWHRMPQKTRSSFQEIKL